MNHAIWIGMAGVAWLAGCTPAEPAQSPSDNSVSVREVRSRIAPARTALKEAKKPKAAKEPKAAPLSDKPTLFQLCGVNVPGVFAEATLFDGGMGIVITTGAREQVNVLRTIARDMSSSNATYSVSLRTSQEVEPEQDDEPQKYDVPQSKATAEEPGLQVVVTTQDIDNGVMLTIAPRQPKDAQLLVARIREDIDQLTSGDCPTGEQTIGALTR